MSGKNHYFELNLSKGLKARQLYNVLPRLFFM